MKNDLGVDPYEWFTHFSYQHDNTKNRLDYKIPENRIDPPAELMEVPTLVTNPKPEKPKKKEETIHEKMYQIATAWYNPFSIGGSENCDSNPNIGGSENASGI